MPYPKIFPSSKIKVNYCCKGVVKQFLECKTKDTTFLKRAFTARFFYSPNYYIVDFHDDYGFSVQIWQ